MEITYLHKNHIFKIKTNRGAAIRYKGVHVSMRKKKAQGLVDECCSFGLSYKCE